MTMKKAPQRSDSAHQRRGSGGVPPAVATSSPPGAERAEATRHRDRHLAPHALMAASYLLLTVERRLADA
jgi:hypothetical protein